MGDLACCAPRRTDVIEAYASDPEMVFDGSDVFLLTTLMSYAGPSHEAIKLQWQQRQIAKLPVMLLTHESLGGFVEACREMLRSACNAEDCEIFIVDEENTKSTKPEDLQLYVAEDRAKSAELDVIMKKAEELGKIMAKIGACATCDGCGVTTVV